MTQRRLAMRYLEMRPLLEALEALDVLTADMMWRLLAVEAVAPSNCDPKRYVRILAQRL